MQLRELSDREPIIGKKRVEHSILGHGHGVRQTCRERAVSQVREPADLSQH